MKVIKQLSNFVSNITKKKEFTQPIQKKFLAAHKRLCCPWERISPIYGLVGYFRSSRLEPRTHPTRRSHCDSNAILRDFLD